MADRSKLAEKDFWNHTPQEIGAALGCGLEGLGGKEARQRLDQYGPNSDAAAKADSLLRAVLRRLLEPLSLILLVAGIISIQAPGKDSIRLRRKTAGWDDEYLASLIAA